MSRMPIPMHDTQSNGLAYGIQQGIDNHKKIAFHLEEAAKHHLEAAKHHAVSEDEKAALSTIKAQGHVMLATQAMNEDARQHALHSCA